MEGDGEANVAYFCLHKLHKLPSEILALPSEERAFIVASINIKIDNDKKESDEIKRKSRKKR